ncbi:hypothetical protein Q8W40_25275 [Vibrio penaeicida]|uniref:hypothetical protein n=1 Tax=Vibrio penaeicida TaxID=104609 RepID=UPI002735FCE9|nr:hypothetical protein [Vibrio penaeicida]MDP2575531.1 hypothetical protein [Vibrio penaeicida]
MRITVILAIAALSTLSGCSRFPHNDIVKWMPLPSLELITPSGEWVLFREVNSASTQIEKSGFHSIESDSLSEAVAKNVITKISLYVMTARLPSPHQQYARWEHLLDEYRD